MCTSCVHDLSCSLHSCMHYITETCHRLPWISHCSTTICKLVNASSLPHSLPMKQEQDRNQKHHISKPHKQRTTFIVIRYTIAYAYVQACMHTYIYIHITYIHTYIHTYILGLKRVGKIVLEYSAVLSHEYSSTHLLGIH